MRGVWGIATGLLVITLAGAAHAAGGSGKVFERLDHLRSENLWGEAVFDGDKVRSIKVDSMTTDSVSVIEVLGPLQQRLAVYALDDIRSVRELGTYRIPQQRAPFLERKSPAALPGDRGGNSRRRLLLQRPGKDGNDHAGHLRGHRRYRSRDKHRRRGRMAPPGGLDQARIHDSPVRRGFGHESEVSSVKSEDSGRG